MMEDGETLQMAQCTAKLDFFLDKPLQQLQGAMQKPLICQYVSFIHSFILSFIHSFIHSLQQVDTVRCS